MSRSARAEVALPAGAPGGWAWGVSGEAPLGGYFLERDMGGIGRLEALLVPDVRGTWLGRVWWLLPAWRYLTWNERADLRRLPALAEAELARVEAVLRLGGEP